MGGTHLDVELFIQEKVEAFDVSVDDFSGVNMRQAQKGLHAARI